MATLRGSTTAKRPHSLLEAHISFTMDNLERQVSVNKAQEEMERVTKKARVEGDPYITIKVARNKDLFEQIGRDIYFDLVDHDKVRSFHIQKQMPFSLLKEAVAKEFGVPVQLQFFWLWAKRQNHTYRLDRPLTHQEETQSVGQLRELSDKVQIAELKLFLDVKFAMNLHPIRSPDRSKENILLFFKFYDPTKEELRYVGRRFVKGSGKPTEILRGLKEMAGLAPNEHIELYEEIKFEPTVMCELIDKNLTFRSSQLEDGDIICFQKPPPVKSQTKCRYPDIPSFLEYVCQRQMPTTMNDMRFGIIPLRSNVLSDRSAPRPVKVSAPTTQTSTILMPLPEHPGAGQLFEEGQQRRQGGVLGEKFEDVGGFSVIKTQASLYKRIWLKYGHIATSQVLAASYVGQVTMVSEIMKTIMDMHQRRLTELSSSMIDLWDNKIKMSEKLEFNIKWLRERFEDVKKDFYGMQKLGTTLQEQEQLSAVAQTQMISAEDEYKKAKVRVIEAMEELKKARENMSALGTKIGPLLSKMEMYSNKLLFDGLL